jgi:hypothetical protein
VVKLERPRGAALLGAVGGHHPFASDPVDIRCALAHQTESVGADVGLADIATEDNEDIRAVAARGAGVGKGWA